MSNFMRILVFFDLPIQTKTQRKQATQFRNFLLKDGFYMVQFSVYARICNGLDSVKTHERRIANNNPDSGSVRVLTITERQYEDMKIILGDTSAEVQLKQLELPLIF
jgi:CRISPR-associated protein Cas2